MYAKIWPERVLQVKFGHSMNDQRNELSVQEIRQILGIIADAGLANDQVLSKPIDLGSSDDIMISLSAMGSDGFMSSTLLLRVTVEYRSSNTYIRLVIVPQADGRERDAYASRAMFPAEVADMLDALIAELRRVFPEAPRGGPRYPLPL